MKAFDSYMKDIDQSMMLGMRMMYGGSVTRAEFDEMIRSHREKL